MEDVNILVQLVNSVGFPIVMCGAMFWKMNKSDVLHKEENEKLSEALNNNTRVLERLLVKIGGETNE